MAAGTELTSTEYIAHHLAFFGGVIGIERFFLDQKNAGAHAQNSMRLGQCRCS